MFLFQRRRNRFRFTEKKHSKKGMITLAVAAALIMMYVVYIIIAYHSNGSISAYATSVGLLAMVASVVNLIFAIQSNREEDSFLVFPRAAVVATGISILCWFGTYILGAVS